MAETLICQLQLLCRSYQNNVAKKPNFLSETLWVLVSATLSFLQRGTPNVFVYNRSFLSAIGVLQNHGHCDVRSKN